MDYHDVARTKSKPLWSPQGTSIGSWVHRCCVLEDTGKWSPYFHYCQDPRPSTGVMCPCVAVVAPLMSLIPIETGWLSVPLFGSCNSCHPTSRIEGTNLSNPPCALSRGSVWKKRTPGGPKTCQKPRTFGKLQDFRDKTICLTAEARSLDWFWGNCVWIR